MHVISQIIDGGAIEADGGASAPVGPTVAKPLIVLFSKNFSLLARPLLVPLLDR